MIRSPRCGYLVLSIPEDRNIIDPKHLASRLLQPPLRLDQIRKAALSDRFVFKVSTLINAVICGAAQEIRTLDLSITNRMLYQLS